MACDDPNCPGCSTHKAIEEEVEKMLADNKPYQKLKRINQLYRRTWHGLRWTSYTLGTMALLALGLCQGHTLTHAIPSALWFTLAAVVLVSEPLRLVVEKKGMAVNEKVAELFQDIYEKKRDHFRRKYSLAALQHSLEQASSKDPAKPAAELPDLSQFIKVKPGQVH